MPARNDDVVNFADATVVIVVSSIDVADAAAVIVFSVIVAAFAVDAIVFVDAPFEQRLSRVKARSDWDEVELLRREKSQLALDSKRALSDYVITNTAEAKDADSALAGSAATSTASTRTRCSQRASAVPIASW